MTRLHVLAAVAGAAALAASGALLAPPERPAAPARPPLPAPGADVQPVTTPAAFAGARAPDHAVPAGILQRAADARALDRAPPDPAPACRPPARADADACPPQRQTVEIEWDVDRDR